jgi:hypothetical protein
MQSRFVQFVAVAAALVAPPFAARAQQSMQDFVWATRVSAALDYSSGKYGDTRPTDVVFAPVTVQAAKGPWTVKGSFAWMSVSGPALIIDGTAAGAAGSGADRSVNGPGDLNLSLMYSLEQLWDRGVYIDVTGRFKVPTASFAKGLGTGKIDVAGQLDLAISAGDFLPFAAVGYKVTGSPVGLPLRDVVSASAGVQYAWSERVATGLAYDFRQSALRSSANPQEGSAYLSVRLTERFSINLYGVVGLSRNSPDAGGGLVFTWRPDFRPVPRPPE